MKERKNVYNLPTGDKTLEWYAKAVSKMKTRPATDPTSWYYQAAIHGFRASNPYWKNVGTLPPQAERDMYWERCQHQSWFFLPWHRMYLAYFEQIVVKTIVDLGGPADWALPFWDYSDTSNPQRLNIPSAFTSPAQDSNSLWMPNRNNTVNAADTLLTALNTTFYTTLPNGVTGFGGQKTKFHNGGGPSGGLESLPHNRIHVDISGAMGDPDTAGLDPIFWLHHANIDRLWQVWLNIGNRSNPSDSDWLSFTFNFHDKDGKPATMKPENVLDTRTVLSGYTYEGLPAQSATLLQESNKLFSEAKQPLGMPLEVVAASNKSLSLEKGLSKITIPLTPSKLKSEGLKLFSERSVASEKKRMLLRFENIKGKGLPPVYSVFINALTEEDRMITHYAGSLALFGLERSSSTDEHHSGSGLTEQLDVTDLIVELRKLPNWDESKLDIHISPNREVNQDVEVSIGRISLYSE
jgi:tyrosinase